MSVRCRTYGYCDRNAANGGVPEWCGRLPLSTGRFYRLHLLPIHAYHELLVAIREACRLGGRVLFLQKVAVYLLHRSIDDAVAGSG